MKLSEMKDREVYEMPDIGNYYGGLCIRKDGEKFEWSIENYSGYNWVEIPCVLAAELMKLVQE